MNRETSHPESMEGAENAKHKGSENAKDSFAEMIAAAKKRTSEMGG